MDTQSIKEAAKRIIAIASDREHGSKTWDEQPSAPKGGFTDRAGFVLLNDIEAYADVSITEPGSGILRARIAKMTEEEGKERFFIATLDFSADANSVKKIIEDRAHLSVEMLTDLLAQEHTTPKLIHVSYGTGRDGDGNVVGTRYEYSEEQMAALTEDEVKDFSRILNLILA